MPTSTMVHHRLSLLTLVACALSFAEGASAQSDRPIINVPPNGTVMLQNIPRTGEEVLDALLTSRVDHDPLQSHIGNTRVCLVTGLWECHTWYYTDGTGVEFYARKKPDGTLALASTEFTYRITGGAGEYHLCRKPIGAPAETCEPQKFDTMHYLYDEWFENYDRPAQAGFPAYPNVHEQHALISGHR